MDSIKYLRKYLRSRCPEDLRGKLDEALTSAPGRQVGLLLNERMVNVPPQVAPALHTALLKDLDWAVKNEVRQGLRWGGCAWDRV